MNVFRIKEEAFWRNYFYRVSLIKQSTQLTSLAQETGGQNRYLIHKCMNILNSLELKETF